MKNHSDADHSHSSPWWETVAIILAVVSLWPLAFKVDIFWAQVPMYFMLAVMVFVFVRRIRRMIRAGRRHRHDPSSPF